MKDDASRSDAPEPGSAPDAELQDRTVERTVGSRVSHYEILTELGRGGMGVVYKAMDLDLERLVALKSPWPDLVNEPRVIERFMREGRASSQLLHAHIVPVFEVFEADGVPYMAMELIEGDNLRDIVRAKGPLPLRQILQHAEGLADALKTAHAKGILHRDVKPNNILVGGDSRARLSDFGLVRFFDTGQMDHDATRSLSLTETGMRVGTLAYMSPEQMLGKPLEPNSDIFSLGAVIYEMCTGRQAFKATSQGEYLDVVLHKEPDAIARFNYDVPQELVRIVRKSLAKQADERYQSAAELLVDLRTLRRQLETGEFSGTTLVEAQRQPRGKRVATLAGAFALVAIAATAITWWVTQRETDTGPPPTSRSRQVTRAPSWEGEPVVSPDGGIVAYSSNESGNADIWIVDVRGGEALRLTEDSGSDRSPAWYPDGSTVAFVSDRTGQPSIWKTPRLGGSKVLVVPGAEFPAISPDGTRIAYSQVKPNGYMRIAVAPLDDPSQVTVLTGDDDGVWDHVHPAWSPDGKSICYSEFRDLWVVPASGEGTASPLTTDHATDREPVWSPSGEQIYFSSMREGTLALWRISPRGGVATRLTLGTGPETHPSISGDRIRLAYSTFTGDTDLVFIDRDTGSRTTLKMLSTETTPALAPDNSSVVFASDRRGRYDLWLQPLSEIGPTGEPRLLIDQPGAISHPSFAPDGRRVAYLRVHEQQSDIWIMSLDGGLPKRFADHAAADIQPTWSPDGTRIAFVSNRDGEHHIWVRPVDGDAPGGEARRITSGESRDLYPAWSPDGKSLAYVSEREGESDNVWLVSAEGRSSPKRLTEDLDAWHVRWEPTGESLLFSVSGDDGDREIRRVFVESGDVESPGLEVDFGYPEALGEFDLSRDGRWLVYVVENMRGDVWVMDATSGAY